MNRSLLAAAVSLAITAPAHAGLFIGGEVGSMDLEGNAQAVGQSSGGVIQDDLERDGGTLNLRAGYLWDNHRAYAMVHLPNTDEGIEIDFSSLHYNFVTNLPSEQVRAYLGASLGFMEYTEEDSYFDGSAAELSGPMYGPEAGVLVTLTDNLELELGVRYWVTNVDEQHQDRNVPGIEDVDWDVEIDNVTEWGLGLNWHF